MGFLYLGGLLLTIIFRSAICQLFEILKKYNFIGIYYKVIRTSLLILWCGFQLRTAFS